MAFPHAVLHPVPFPPCDLLHVWSDLSQGFRDTLDSQSVDSAVLFRHLFDGSEGKAVKLVAILVVWWEPLCLRLFSGNL